MNLICVEDGIDNSKDSGKLMIYVLSAVTEIEGLEKQHRQLTGAKARLGNLVCVLWHFKTNGWCDSLSS